MRGRTRPVRGVNSVLSEETVNRWTRTVFHEAAIVNLAQQIASRRPYTVSHRTADCLPPTSNRLPHRADCLPYGANRLPLGANGLLYGAKASLVACEQPIYVHLAPGADVDAAVRDGWNRETDRRAAAIARAVLLAVVQLARDVRRIVRVQDGHFRAVVVVPDLGFDQPDDGVARAVGRDDRTRAWIRELLLAARRRRIRHDAAIDGEVLEDVVARQDEHVAVEVRGRRVDAAREGHLHAADHAIAIDHVQTAVLAGDEQRPSAGLFRQQDRPAAAEIEIAVVQQLLVARRVEVLHAEVGAVQAQPQDAIAVVASAIRSVEAAVAGHDEDVTVRVHRGRHVRLPDTAVVVVGRRVEDRRLPKRARVVGHDPAVIRTHV